MSKKLFLSRREQGMELEAHPDEDEEEDEEEEVDNEDEEDGGGYGQSVKAKSKIKAKSGTSPSMQGKIRGWTKEEDSVVKQLIGVLGRKWTKVGNEINRTGKQVRERFLNTLDPDIARDVQGSRIPWTFEEDVTLHEGTKIYGARWVVIKKQLFPNRAESDVKNRFTHQQYASSIKQYKAGRKPSGPSPTSSTQAHTLAHAHTPAFMPSIQTIGSSARAPTAWPLGDMGSSAATTGDSPGEEATSPLNILARMAASESEKSENRFRQLLDGMSMDLETPTTPATPSWGVVGDSFKSLSMGGESFRGYGPDSCEPGDSSKSVGMTAVFGTSALTDLL